MTGVVPVYTSFPTFSEWSSFGYTPTTFDRYEELFYAAKRAATDSDMRKAVNAATRMAAIDTGAIEGLYEVDRGFTRTVAMETEAWQLAMDQREPVVARSFDDALAAYEFVLDAATRRERITDVWIRELHKIMCASQETYTVYTAVGRQEQALPKGRYKTQANSPMNLSTGRLHAYASPDDTPAEMYKLLDQLDSPEFLAAHPVLQAAYAHYGFVCIHPFADGNGRVARGLSSVYLYRKPGIPLVMFADQKADYIDALELSDAGRYAEFASFVNDRAIDTIGLINVQVNRSALPPLATSVSRIADLAGGRAGLTGGEMDAASSRLVDLTRLAFTKLIGEAGLPRKIQFDAIVVTRTAKRPPPAGFRPANPQWCLELTLSALTGRDIRVDVVLCFFPAVASHDGAEFVGVSEGGYEDVIEIVGRNIIPVETSVIHLQLSVWAERILAGMTARLADAMSGD